MSLARKLLYSAIVTVAFFAGIELVLVAVSHVVIQERAGGSASAADAYRVLCLGDSFTYGQYVDEEESYPAQLDRLLREEYGVDWRVINGGAPGRSPRGLYRPLRRILASEHRPDLLLLLAGFNGPSDRAILEFEQRRGRRVDATRRASIHLQSTLLSLRSYRVLRSLLLRFVDAPGELEAGFVPAGFRQATWRRYQEVNQANLQALIDLAEGTGVDVVLLNYPQAPVPENPISDIEYYYAIYLRVSHPKTPLRDEDYLFPRSRPDEMAINAMIRFTARANDLPLVDTFSAIVDRDDHVSLFVEGDEHPNGRGYGIVARAVGRVLEREGYLRKAPTRREAPPPLGWSPASPETESEAATGAEVHAAGRVAAERLDGIRGGALAQVSSPPESGAPGPLGPRRSLGGKSAVTSTYQAAR